MSKFTKEMVDSYANKLLFNLTGEENQMVLDEFEVIDKTIDLINEIDGIDKLEPMTHALDDFVVDLRDDISEESIELKDALRNAGATEGREIEVPKVVE
jgi:aspartyl/glutamyl-tRNA(Asn/Gln) amidotransferase C subunit